MYVNRLTSSADLIGPTPPAAEPTPGSDEISRAILAGALAQMYHGEYLPALREAARRCIAFYAQAVVVRALHERFVAVGLTVPLPPSLACAPADLAELARAMVEAKLIDAADPVLHGISLTG